MKTETYFEKCPKCGKMFAHRKGEILDDVCKGVVRGVDGFYCMDCMVKLEHHSVN